MERNEPQQAWQTCSCLQEISWQVSFSGRWDIREALRRTCRRPRRRRPRRRRPRRRRPRRCRRRCRRGHQAEISGVPWSPDVCLANFTPTSPAASFAIVFFRGLGKFCPLQDTAPPAWRIAIGRRRSRLVSPSTSCAGLSARSCQQGKVFHAGVTQVGAFKGGSGPEGLYSLSSNCWFGATSPQHNLPACRLQLAWNFAPARFHVRLPFSELTPMALSGWTFVKRTGCSHFCKKDWELGFSTPGLHRPNL